ncbi:MAG TPA: hypothetical protein VEJ20_06070 [Candidatus Eremiobacteraceae bacterium]|nr:hypothetical protein [Candidatus Eremiobacteraceae bacterium]
MQSTSLADAIPAPQPPIDIVGCGGDYQSISNPNLKVGISFINTSDVEATDVTFDILLLDTNAKILEGQSVSIEGKFAPNAMIQPRHDPWGNALLTQPEYPNSPAWDVANHHGSDTAHIFCRVSTVKFSNGTSWARPH